MPLLVTRRDRDATTDRSEPQWVPGPAAGAQTASLESRRMSLGTARPEASTTCSSEMSSVEQDVAGLMGIVAPEELEHGADTPLIPALYLTIRQHGADAVFELAASIESSQMDPQLASWVLRWLGKLIDHPSHRARVWLLVRGLQSPVPMIRDGAALGLASIRDIRTVDALRTAAARERYSRLRRNIEMAIRQVEQLL